MLAHSSTTNHGMAAFLISAFYILHLLTLQLADCVPLHSNLPSLPSEKNDDFDFHNDLPVPQRKHVNDLTVLGRFRGLGDPIKDMPFLPRRSQLDAASSIEHLREGPSNVKSSLWRKNDYSLTANEKRKVHKVARQFYTIPGNECLIVTPLGDITATLSRHKCKKYGTFCEINKGSKVNLQMSTGKYLAIDNSGKIYTASSSTNDTNLINSIANLFNFTVNIYRMVNNSKCYLNASSRTIVSFCSHKPFVLKSQIVGTCA